ncbi:hypothetical protein [Microtetraspora malaysiensis]|uniref:Cytochrome b561 domain-containing protein n=1 Tax=Microtetraspora malaysiensis TaxID=161358 RepID=A0ABW6T389_9ACTN
MFLRIALLAQTVAVLVQAVTAGLLLSTPGGRTAHSATAIGVVVTVLLHLVAALLTTVPGSRAPSTRQRSTILPAVGMLAMTVVQVALGLAHMKAFHVPLGVLMFGVSMVRLNQVWSVGRAKTASA